MKPRFPRPPHAHPPPTSAPVPIAVDLIVDSGIDLPLDADRLRQAAVAAARHRGADRGQLGIRVTDDTRIHRVNRDHLGHDHATDVISFGYTWQRPHIEGELIVSAETARREAAQLGWPPDAELILYVVHGVLHIAGLRDATPPERAAMRQSERAVLSGLGIDQPDRVAADAAETQADETEGPKPAKTTGSPAHGDLDREGSA